MAQFYVDDIYLDGQEEIPVDNFYWMTDSGRKIRLVMHAGEVFLEVGNESYGCANIPEGLRLMAKAIEDTNRSEWAHRLDPDEAALTFTPR